MALHDKLLEDQAVCLTPRATCVVQHVSFILSWTQVLCFRKDKLFVRYLVDMSCDLEKMESL